jgi:hypothetical protein
VLQDTSVITCLHQSVIQASLDTFTLHLRDTLLLIAYSHTNTTVSDHSEILDEQTSALFILVQLIGTLLNFSHTNKHVRECLVQSQSHSSSSHDLLSTCDLLLRLLSSSFDFSSSSAISLVRTQDEEYKHEMSKNVLILLCNLTHDSAVVQV